MSTPLERQRAATVAVWRADVAARPAGAWADLGGLAVHRTGLPLVYWNGAHLTEPAGLARLPEAAAWFGDVPWGLLSPQEWEVDLPHITDQKVMLRSLTALPDVPGLDLRWGGEGMLEVQEAAFGDELLEPFLRAKPAVSVAALLTAYDGKLPVATARVFCVDGVAGVYGVGTVPSHRRQGLGAAVTVTVLHEAVRRGCDLAFLNPSELGYGVYAELGFQDVLGWSVYRTDAGSAQAHEGVASGDTGATPSP